MNKNHVTATKTQKAGCGIRFDPEQLGEDTGFDFSQAAELLARAQEESHATDSAPEDPQNPDPKNKKPG